HREGRGRGQGTPPPGEEGQATGDRRRDTEGDCFGIGLQCHRPGSDSVLRQRSSTSIVQRRVDPIRAANPITPRRAGSPAVREIQVVSRPSSGGDPATPRTLAGHPTPGGSRTEQSRLLVNARGADCYTVGFKASWVLPQSRYCGEFGPRRP